MMYDIEHHDDVAVLTPTASLEGLERLVARRQLDDVFAAGTTRLVFDLSRMRQLHSSGVGSLVAAHHRARAAGGAICLCGLTESLQRTLDLMLIHQILPICADRKDAITRVREAAERNS